MKTDKESGAIRLMEAFGAASEELLERSEKAGRPESGGKKAGIRLFVQKYAKACAACLCLVVLGAAYFGISQMRMGSAGKADTKSAGSGDGYNGSAAKTEEIAQEEIAQEGIENQAPMQIPDQAEDLGLSDGAEPVFAEPVWLDVESLQEIAAAANKAEADGQEAVSQEVRRQDVEAENTPTENFIKQNASAAVPAVPAGYDLIRVEGSLYYEWSDGEHGLWLKLTRTELTADLRFDVEPPVYTVQQDWKELLPPAGGSEYLQFALLYENGMLAEYCGALEQDEIALLMESLLEIDLP